MRFGGSSSSACRPNSVTVLVTSTMGFVGSLAHSGWSGGTGSSCCIIAKTSTDASSRSLESSVTGSGLSETLIDAGLILSLVNTRLGVALVDIIRNDALLLTVCTTLPFTFAVSLGFRDMRLASGGCQMV
jgi:hypothetical protein